MHNAELCQAVLAALEEARPDAMLPVLRPLLAEHLQARDVRMLLANYELTALRPIQTPDNDETMSAGPAGHCFVSQDVTTAPAPGGGTAVWLPVTVRGDRIGVLQLTLPAEPSPSEVPELHRLAVTVAHAIRAAAGQTDLLARAARSQRLSLAAELQWQLLPGRGARAPEYDIAGHLEPAYHVHADTFDWCQDEDHLILSIVDGRPGGQATPLLSTLTLTALRNARRAALAPADQARLAGEAVYAHHQGNSYVGALLVQIDLRSGLATTVLAGSPRLFVLREQGVYQPQLSGQDPLGVAEDTDYGEEQFSLAHGDRMLLVSDGIHAARSTSDQCFGEARLSRLLLRTADESAGRVVRAVIEELYEHRQHSSLEDDAVAVCLDWTGPSHSPDSTPSRTAANGVELRVAKPPLLAIAPWPPRQE